MTLTITAEQRDALYDNILDRLSAIGDVWTAASKEDYEAADRLGREFSDSLMLVLGDLGWGEGTGEPVELTAPPDVLRRAFTRLRDLASSHTASIEEEQQEAREMEERNRLVMEACMLVLTDLDETPTGS
jgi:hypothetical protein